LGAWGLGGLAVRYFLFTLGGLLFLAGCTDKSIYTSDGLTIRFLRSESYEFTRAEKRAIESISQAAIPEMRKLLPGVPPHIELTVRPGTNVSPETGEGGDAMPPNGLMFTVDPSRPGGVMPIVDAWLRSFLFHDIHHLVRYRTEKPTGSIVERAVTEGMATAFERDFAGTAPPMGAYPDNVAEWAAQLLALPEGASSEEWLFRHPDGRRWIGYKVGTYWVDRAIKASGGSAASLVATPAMEILSLAEHD
jgi:hypothetical protein